MNGGFNKMSECTHNCETCGQDCADRKTSFQEAPHRLSNIKKVIGVVSGKGGVGKSSVTAMLAVLAQRDGYKVAILDADITGPSIPKAFGLKEKAMGNKFGLYPVTSKTGIDVKTYDVLDRTHDGVYASDHFPIYIEIELN